MFLIVGLGNPGTEYAATRHNIGFMTADYLHEKYNFSPFKSKFDGLIAEGKINNEKVLLLKPQTFMNLSGNSVVKAANFYKILPQNVIVIHDDMDLKPGVVREKIGGGSAGHNGIKSIDAAVGADYRRIRIGIGHPRDFGLLTDPADWVLGKFTDSELEKINTAISQINLFE